MLVPFQFDGVPGVSFPGIKPGQTFVYEFPVLQSGTYWYHSHSNMQEAMGLAGALIVDPAEPDPVTYDREHVLMLSDWSFLHPHQLLLKLKQQSGYFNRRKRTLLDAGTTQAERLVWAKMRMDPTDIADVGAPAYRYIVNGHDSAGNWTGTFRPGERVRLRIINGSAMTNFNVRIPGLAMTVVQADGMNVQPVETDEFQIGIAETFDVIVQPTEDRAYAFVAESIDRSGQCRATLAPRMGMVAAIPPLRQRPLLTMRDMGMGDMAGMDHGAMGQAPAAGGEAVLDLSQPAGGAETAPAVLDLSQPDAPMAGMGAMKMGMRDKSNAPQVKFGPGVATISPMPADRTGDRPTGLEDVDHRVLTYQDLKSLAPNPDPRLPTRSIDVHLTGNMERYMWSIDGEQFSSGVQPIAFRHNERVRINLINDTMMPHPIHLHGHFFELVTGEAGHHPLKHTVNVLPGAKVALNLTASALGDWAFHCHMLLHMHAGMFRVVTVRQEQAA
jgi:CopA family copper-resistance protein